MIRSLCHKTIHAGVDGETPETLTNRILFTNSVCLIGIILTVSLGLVNLFKGYYVLCSLNVFYLTAILACLNFNFRRRYLASRMTLLTASYLLMLFSCLYQGRVAEVEHFFLPFSVVGFCIYSTSERRYSFLFMLACLASYFS